MTTEPAPLILIQPHGPAIAFNAYGMTAPEILSALRRCLIHVAAQQAGLLTVEALIPPAAAAAPPKLPALSLTVAPASAPLNGHSKPAATETEPAPAAAPAATPRKKPGPQPGTKRRRKTDIDEIEAQAQRDTWT